MEGNEEVRELPRNWISARIGDLGEVITGSTPSKKDSSFFGGNIPFYKPTDLDAGYEVIEAREHLSELGASESRIIPAFSILVTCIGATIGKTGLARRICATNQQINAIVLLLNYVNPKWLFWMISSPRGQQMIVDNSSATTMPIINKSRFTELIFPVPPLSEQSRIVEKIEELFSDLDQGIESLETAQKQFKVYRQVVLKWAFEGKLTEKWRASQIHQKKLDIKTGEELLAQIKAERDRRYQQQLKEWEEAVKEWEVIGKSGKKPTKPQKPKDFLPLTEAELSELPQLPGSWYWMRIGDATHCLDSMRIPINKKEREGRNGNIPYYGANGQVGWIDDYLFDEPLILVVEDETFVGREKPFSYKIISKSWVNNHAHILRPEEALDIDYLNYQLFYYPFTPLTTGTIGRKKLTQDALINAPMKLCSIGEQQQIAQEIEFRFSICDCLEDTIIENLQKAEALRQSILKQAFEGKLVPQDPNDEPAEKLLERIKQEKIKVKKGEQLSIQGI